MRERIINNEQGQETVKKTSITIAIQNFLFEKRLCWQLSSISQQTGNKPDIQTDIAYVKNMGKPFPQDVLWFFKKKGLIIKSHEYKTMADIQYRGFTRNKHIQDCNTEWILFADADMVYPVDFFEQLNVLLCGEFKDSPHCLIVGRYSTYLEETEKLIDNYEYPCMVTNAFDKCSKLNKKRKSNVGAGYFHLANVKNVRDNFQGLYCNPKKIRDKSWETDYPRARSDGAFKHKLGKKKLPIQRIIHLQHTRGSIEGKGKMIYDQR